MMNKKFMAKISALMLSIILMLGVVACGNEPTTSTGTFDGVLEENVTLRVLENDTAIEEGYFDELLTAFNAKYASQGIKAVDANMDQYLNLEDDGPYGYGPDILYQANDALMKYVDGKHILPLPVEQLDCYDEVSQTSWDAYTTVVDGTSYVCGVPVNVQGALLVYRKDMLPADWETTWDSNNNDIPDMIETWNNMYKYSTQIIDDSNGKKYGYMKSINDAYFNSGFLFSYGATLFGEDGTDIKDIGFSDGSSYLGAEVLKSMSSIMNEQCIDDSITLNAYSKIATGDYFSTIATPDNYALFYKEMVTEYQKEGLTLAEAEKKAEENLVMTDLPMLPKSGDLTEENPELIATKMMGGVNGYAISSYTAAPNAALAFVDFATSYEMVEKRIDILQIAPARQDLVDKANDFSEVISNNFENGNTIVMPSVRQLSQVWSPLGTFLADLAGDAFRNDSAKKYVSVDSIKTALTKLDENIYSAIHTLS